MNTTREQFAQILSRADIDSAGSVALIGELIEAGASTEQIERDLGLYQRGRADALAKVATAVGVAPETWALSGLDPRPEDCGGK